MFTKIQIVFDAAEPEKPRRILGPGARLSRRAPAGGLLEPGGVRPVGGDTGRGVR